MDGPSLHSGAFYWYGFEDGIYRPVLDEGVASLFTNGLGLLLHPDL